MRCRLRKCSKTLQNLIDNTAWEADQIWMKVENDAVLLYFELEEWNGKRKKNAMYYYKKSSANEQIEQAIIDISVIFKCPKTTVSIFWVSDFRTGSLREKRSEDMTFLDCFCREMSKLQHKLNVKKLFFELRSNQHEQSRIVSFFNPQKIKVLELKARKRTQDMSRVIALEQWKHAEKSQSLRIVILVLKELGRQHPPSEICLYDLYLYTLYLKTSI